MITIYKTEKSYYETSMSKASVIDMLIECLPDEFNEQELHSLNEDQLAERLHQVIDMYEISEWLDSELVERDSGDEWEIGVDNMRH